MADPNQTTIRMSAETPPPGVAVMLRVYSIPTTTSPTNSFRFKGGRLQQLHSDPRGGYQRWWIDVPSVPEDASDVG